MNNPTPRKSVFGRPRREDEYVVCDISPEDLAILEQFHIEEGIRKKKSASVTYSKKKIVPDYPEENSKGLTVPFTPFIDLTQPISDVRVKNHKVDRWSSFLNRKSIINNESIDNRLKELLRKFVETKDQKIFTNIFNLLHDPSIKILRNVLDLREIAMEEDIFQDALMTLHRRADTLDENKSVWGWFKIVLKNKAKDILKQERNIGRFGTVGVGEIDTVGVGEIDTVGVGEIDEEESNIVDFLTDEQKTPEFLKVLQEVLKEVPPSYSKIIKLLSKNTPLSQIARKVGMYGASSVRYAMDRIYSLVEERMEGEEIHTSTRGVKQEFNLPQEVFDSLPSKWKELVKLSEQGIPQKEISEKIELSLGAIWKIIQKIKILKDKFLNKSDAPNKVVESLTPQQQEIFKLRSVGKMPYNEIAEKLGIPETVARNTFSRIKIKIEKMSHQEKGLFQ